MKNKIIVTLIATSMILSMTGCGANPVANLFDKDAKVCVIMLGGSYSSVSTLFGDSVIVSRDDETYKIINPATGEKLLEEVFIHVYKCSDLNAKYVIGVQETDAGYVSTVYDENFNAVYTYSDEKYQAFNYVNGYLFTFWKYEEDGTTEYEYGIFDTSVADAEPTIINGEYNVEYQIYNGNLYRMSNKFLTSFVSADDWTETDDLNYVNYGEEDYMVFRTCINGEGYVLATEYTPNGEGSYSSVATGLYNINDGSFASFPEECQAYKTWSDHLETVGALGSVVLITDQEYEEGEDKDNRTYRLYDTATGQYIGDGEYMSLSACMYDSFDDYTMETTPYYLVKFADETWGYLDSDFNNLGASYDDAASMQTITDEEGNSMNIAIVVEDGQASVVVDGTTPLEKYYTTNEKGKCVKSETCPIGEINSSYYAGASTDGSTRYYAVTSDDDKETYQLVAVSLVD